VFDTIRFCQGCKQPLRTGANICHCCGKRHVNTDIAEPCNLAWLSTQWRAPQVRHLALRGSVGLGAVGIAIMALMLLVHPAGML
jgi:predicted amidophosphoribosyltransferase